MKPEELKDPRDRAHAQKSENRHRAKTYKYKSQFDEERFREEQKKDKNEYNRIRKGLPR